MNQTWREGLREGEKSEKVREGKTAGDETFKGREKSKL